MSGMSHGDDPVWEQALNWVILLQETPGDQDVSRRRDIWLAESEAHVRAYRKAEKIWRLTGQVVPVVAEPSPPSRRRVRVGVMSVVMAMAAAVALLVLPGYGRFLWSDYHTGSGETRQVTLADQSVVVLDAESAANVTFSSDRRAVSLLSGRAFFKVSPDRSRPFVVSAQGMTVTVTGTAFEVSSRGDDVAVEVQSGTVAVAVAQGGRHMTASLGQGGRAHVSSQGGSLAVDDVPPAQVGLWRSGRLAVNGATVAEVVAELRRRHAGVILLQDPVLAARRVTGVFDMNDPAVALDAVLQPHGGRVRQLTPYVLVVSPR
ncbi:FecR family protein [Magnetospirillum aberrantis]|uniref:DUF4880 domain-containing protein n=1 Tax=Magnetospirillum aberrantis SpK TaxID=908842 RepID=A0A7C9QUP5_9PROT|nr:FecR domain-containing protein [Magnetospirillum aberrantis]NFV81058.1 DUF4880 domain-containing protein [Magnetospirillum aberrantis SpK]